MSTQRDRQENLLSDCVNSLKSWKNLIETHLDHDEQAAELNELKEIVQEFCLIEFNNSKSLQACEEITDHFKDDASDPKADVDALYNKKVSGATFTGNYEDQNIWKELFLGQEDVTEFVPTASQVVQDGEFEEINDSVSCLNVFTPPVDPISQMVIEEPFKNRKCGHVYEHRFILQYIKSMKHKARCPYVGCTNQNMMVGDLVEDKMTKAKIIKYAESQASTS